MNTKKIAIVSSSFPPLEGGGISTAHYNLSSLLEAAGYPNKTDAALIGGEAG